MTRTTITPDLYFARRCDDALSVYYDALGTQVDMICGKMARVHKAKSVFHLRSLGDNVLR